MPLAYFLVDITVADEFLLLRIQNRLFFYYAISRHSFGTISRVQTYITIYLHISSIIIYTIFNFTEFKVPFSLFGCYVEISRVARVYRK